MSTATAFASVLTAAPIQPLVRFADVGVTFGGVGQRGPAQAVGGVALLLGEGEFVSLVGPAAPASFWRSSACPASSWPIRGSLRAACASAPPVGPAPPQGCQAILAGGRHLRGGLQPVGMDDRGLAGAVRPHAGADRDLASPLVQPWHDLHPGRHHGQGSHRRRIGVWPGREHLELLRMLHRVGIHPGSVTFVPLNDTVEGMVDRRTDCAQMTTYHAIHQLEHAAGGLDDFAVFRAADVGAALLKNGLFARRDWIEQHPAETQAVVDAVLAGWTWAFPDPDEAVAACEAARPDMSGAEHARQLANIGALVRTGATLTEGLEYPDPQHMSRAAKAMPTVHGTPVLSRLHGAVDPRFGRRLVLCRRFCHRRHLGRSVGLDRGSLDRSEPRFRASVAHGGTKDRAGCDDQRTPLRDRPQSHLRAAGHPVPDCDPGHDRVPLPGGHPARHRRGAGGGSPGVLGVKHWNPRRHGTVPGPQVRVARGRDRGRGLQPRPEQAGVNSPRIPLRPVPLEAVLAATSAEPAKAPGEPAHV